MLSLLHTLRLPPLPAFLTAQPDFSMLPDGEEEQHLAYLAPGKEKLYWDTFSEQIMSQ